MNPTTGPQYASHRRVVQRCCSEAAVGSQGTLEHQLRPFEGEVYEPLGPTLERHTEAEQPGVEVERDVEIGDIELRHEKSLRLRWDHT